MKTGVPFEKDLVHFLIENNVAIRFTRNLKESRFGIVRKGVKLKTSRLLRPLPPEKYIQSFSWDHTKQGKPFWLDIHKKWIERLQRIKKESL